MYFDPKVSAFEFTKEIETGIVWPFETESHTYPLKENLVIVVHLTATTDTTCKVTIKANLLEALKGQQY